MMGLFLGSKAEGELSYIDQWPLYTTIGTLQVTKHRQIDVCNFQAASRQIGEKYGVVGVMKGTGNTGCFWIAYIFESSMPLTALIN